jgi:putative mRNA 3-end processing factor
MSLLEFTSKGIYCPQAKVHIDPWRPVERALITHGHADHSRWGHKSYLCTTLAKPVIRYRLGNVNIQSLDYGEPVVINGVKFSFHPAGHIIGSAQIRVEYKGEVWVASGDYKTTADGLSTPFEAIKCHTFITESTFGLPIYRWPSQEQVFASINQWWADNQAAGKVSLLTAYALGKAQRLLHGIDSNIGKIYTHGAIENTNRVIRKQGIELPETIKVTPKTSARDVRGHLVMAPPSAIGSPWVKKFQPLSIGIASGWMALRGTRRRRAADRGFMLSDHADWDGLNQAIDATGAEQVIATHGYSAIFARWLREEKGLHATEAKTEYEGESITTDDTAATDNEI